MGFVGFPGQAGRYVSGPGLTRTIGPEPRRSRTPGPAA